MKDYINEILNYNPITGEITWRVHLKFTKGYPGDIAGCLDKKGYRIIRFTFAGQSKNFKAHRIAWLIMTGNWPTEDIDHKNGNKSHNAWKNLRLAPGPINHKNRKLSARNSSGTIGVCFIKGSSKWRAYTGENKYLGEYATKNEAITVRKQAERLDGAYGPVHGS